MIIFFGILSVYNVHKYQMIFLYLQISACQKMSVEVYKKKHAVIVTNKNINLKRWQQNISNVLYDSY